MTNTIVTTTLDNYQPTIDLAEISLWDAHKLVTLLQSLSNVIAAAIPEGEASPVLRYLDDWQALFTEATFRIADIVVGMEPTTTKDQRGRNWLLASVRLACAEGLMDLTGEGAPEYDDTYSRGMVQQRAAT